MPTAFVMITTEIGTMEEVRLAIKKLEGVEEAYSVYGVYDIVSKIRAESMDKLKEVVVENIRRLRNVQTTLTMIVIEGP